MFLRRFTKNITKIHFSTIEIIYLLVWYLVLVLIWKNMFVFDGESYWAGWGHLWADWSVHIHYVLNMANRSLILPYHPLYSGVPFRYHFMADLISAVLLNSGISLVNAFIIPSILCSWILVTSIFVFFRYVFRNSISSMVSTVIFICNGGLGFLWYVYYLITNNPIIHRVSPVFTFSQVDNAKIEFANVMTNYFLPQRPFLLGFPLSIIIILLFYRTMRSSKAPNENRNLVLLGIATGCFPLIHMYSFFAILFFTGFIAMWDSYNKRELEKRWLYFFIPSVSIGFWLFLKYWGLRDVHSVRFKPFWTSDGNIFRWIYYWTLNQGFLFILGPISWIHARKTEKIMTIPFAALFLISNIFIFQPHTWDNAKFITYSYLWSAGLVGSYLYKSYIVQSITIHKKIGIILLFYFCIFSGMIDIVNLTLFDQQKFRFFKTSDLEFGKKIRSIIPKDEIILTGPISSHVSMLSGRQLFIGLDFWVRSYGIKTEERNKIVSSIYEGKDNALQLLDFYQLKYLAITPQELAILPINYDFINANFIPILRTDKSTIYKRK